jgi:uncharacterized protein YkwD
MSRVCLGRARRCAGTVAAALTLLCTAGAALGRASAGGPPEVPALPRVSSLASGLVGRLTSAVTGLTAPLASASRACAYQNVSVRRASTGELRASVVCLINRFRSLGGLPRLVQQGRLDVAAQGHDNQMVRRRYFGHGGIPASSPALRISAAGFSWGAYGEAISTGFWTPQQAVAAWLRSLAHCQILLSPEYRYIGVGVNPQPVAGWTQTPGTWTADLALPLGWASPSRNWGLAHHCPY